MSRKKPKAEQRRTVSISIAHPISVEVTCVRDGNDPDSDWQIERVENASVEVTPRGFAEHAGSDGLDELYRKLDAAEDNP